MALCDPTRLLSSLTTVPAAYPAPAAPISVLFHQHIACILMSVPAHCVPSVSVALLPDVTWLTPSRRSGLYSNIYSLGRTSLTSFFKALPPQLSPILLLCFSYIFTNDNLYHYWCSCYHFTFLSVPLKIGTFFVFSCSFYYYIPSS